MTDRPGLSVRSSFRLGMNRVVSLPAPAPAIEIVPRISSFVHWSVLDRVGMKLDSGEADDDPGRRIKVPAPVADVGPEGLGGVVTAISERLVRETGPDRAKTIWAATRVLRCRNHCGPMA